MADWRQIQARIRKAKTSSDPPAQLAELFERTRDAMVAFELAQWHEKAGNASDTVQWYTTAAQRFRRAQWRTKAEEALTRLGAPIPEPLPAPVKEPAGAATISSGAEQSEEPAENVPQRSYEVSSEPELTGMHASNGHELSAKGAAESAEESAGPSAPADALAAGKRRRRGRRGGRKRHGRGPVGQQVAGEATAQRPVMPMPGRQSPQRLSESGTGEVSAGRSFSAEPQSEPSTRSLEPPAEARPHAAPSGSVGSTWQAASGGLVSSRSRAGEPGLSSRIAQLESQLRRLLACPLASLDDAEQAPAGPGVLLLSDSDQVTHYYVEACQTLRIGIGNLVRGGRGAKGGSQLKPSMAEHLGINESRVAKYLKDHCTVRWIQLDEGAPELAHFATAVLRPVVAE
jgi:hypothetical protein